MMSGSGWVQTVLATILWIGSVMGPILFVWWLERKRGAEGREFRRRITWASAMLVFSGAIMLQVVRPDAVPIDRTLYFGLTILLTLYTMVLARAFATSIGREGPVGWGVTAAVTALIAIGAGALAGGTLVLGYGHAAGAMLVLRLGSGSFSGFAVFVSLFVVFHIYGVFLRRFGELVELE